jgi:hypothetical protein
MPTTVKRLAPLVLAQLASRKRGVAGALLMLTVHVLVCMAFIWSMLDLPPRYEKLFSDHGIRLPALTEVAFTLADLATARPDLLWAPLLFLLGLDAAALFVPCWCGERGLSWAWFLVMLGLLLLPMTLLGAGIYLAESKLQQRLSRPKPKLKSARCVTGTHMLPSVPAKGYRRRHIPGGRASLNSACLAATASGGGRAPETIRQLLAAVVTTEEYADRITPCSRGPLAKARHDRRLVKGPRIH